MFYKDQFTKDCEEIAKYTAAGSKFEKEAIKEVSRDHGADISEVKRTVKIFR